MLEVSQVLECKQLHAQAHDARAQAGLRGGAILERTATRAKLREVHAVAIGTASPRA